MLKNKPFAIFLSLALISLSLIPLSQAYSATDAVISLKSLPDLPNHYRLGSHNSGRTMGLSNL